MALATVATLTVAVGLPISASSASAATSNDANPTACAHRVNNTPEKLVACVTKGDLWAHMVKFQQIADANPGPDGHPSRNSGEPGYKASADYVARVMRAAGYRVTLQEYKFHYFSFVGTPVMRDESTGHSFGLGTDFNPAHVAGSTTAKVQPAGGIVVPATPAPSSASGCQASDFAGFVPGNIALIQRGTCTFAQKVANAEAAGASAAIIFNEGNPGRTSLFNGSLAGTEQIPVLFTSYAVGTQLLAQYVPGSAPVLTVDVKLIDDPNRSDWNVIADSRGGDPNNILVIDAHLDAIYGAGMLDNASGSAAILDIAQQLKNTNTRNKLRFIWFGGEELGLLGSNYYVSNLAASELAKIKFDLDADVLGTPNYVAGVLDPKDGVNLFGRTPGTPMSPSIWAPSAIGRDYGIDYLNSIGKNHILFSADGTDAFVFQQAGIPASGVLTGQDCCKLASDVALFGGYQGNFEGTVPGDDGGCVDNPFRWCDNIGNNDPAVLTWMSKTFANMVGHMAYDTKVFDSTKSGGGHLKKNSTPRAVSPRKALVNS
ncbi:PA domain-containing protein [Nakamurella panacisegetis]|uniref:PA domain-containing protein n=1 Tax=Nakamurella panacisegetis TaxID=1090615 RepID=A0A1H0RBJ9_9ACTN|nr:M28 family peptidase [Nakamurella panacisegetis]SDP26811.1 PA domain-containing protein [Nakamurella panacisegetis]